MIQRPPGIEDIFPDRVHRRDFLLGRAREVFNLFNVHEIIIPVMEYTEVFARGIGDETDIVSKEMFTFEDRGGRSLTLRPEGTASVVRAYVENGEYNRLAMTKFFYIGPMFRAERPQKGRLRQFNQFGVEIFGSGHPWHDYEAMAIMDRVANEIGIEHYELVINSIGCQECRPLYLEKLREFYADHVRELCDDCRRRYRTNILRLLDCTKSDHCHTVRQEAPRIMDHLCPACQDHHGTVKELLEADSITYREDPFIVRGLDYYTRTTFEFLSTELGSQSAFAAGGRYDNLVETFGGKPTPAVGFAAGIERMLLLLEKEELAPPALDVYVVHSGEAAVAAARDAARRLRRAGYSVDLDPAGGGFKGQFKKADREKARIACVIGDDEAAAGQVTLKAMESGRQVRVSMETLPEETESLLRD
jgi:histidyl-tRNA synthetase